MGRDKPAEEASMMMARAALLAVALTGAAAAPSQARAELQRDGEASKVSQRPATDAGALAAAENGILFFAPAARSKISCGPKWSHGAFTLALIEALGQCPDQFLNKDERGRKIPPRRLFRGSCESAN